MKDYKSNSFKSREAEKKQLPEKKIEKVAVGKAKRKNATRRFADVFISEDMDNVKSYILMDVLVPAIKKAVSDVMTNGINMILYGESGRSCRNSTASKISYGSCYDRNNSRREPSRTRGRSVYDYDDILFDTKGDAEVVLDAMYDIIDQYGVVSVADFYELADVSTDNFAANKYGWDNLEGSRVIRMRDGDYIIKLPRAKAIQ